MKIEEYLNAKKEIQQEILRLLSSDETIDDLSFDNFTKIIEDQKIREDENEFRSFLHLVDSIAKNHHRSPSFFYVIDNIILMFKNEFAKYLSNSEIFNIFYLNKRIILTLLKNNILIMTPYISNYIKTFMDENSIIYFFNEMKPFFKENENELKNKLEQEMKRIDPDEYEKNRIIGENEKTLCQFIRNDSIDDFIIFVNKTNLSLNTKIESSIFETNLYLNEKEVSLIEYSLFYGSIQIFNYLRLNKVILESSLWNFVIHGRNPELIHLLEENNVKPPINSYDTCFIESIQCHNNEIAEYFQNKYFKDDEEIYKNEEIKSQIINSCNYKYFPNNFIDKNSFFDLCRCDHYFLVKKMLENKDFSEVDFIRQIYNEEDNENQILTPFFAAINNDNTNIIELLIKRPEIDLNFQCTFYTWLSHEFNYNTLYCAVMFDNAKIFKLLLNNKNLDANAKSKERRYQSQYNCSLEEFCPLVESINNQNLEILKILLSNEKVNVNIQLKYMDTQNDKIISLINELTPLYEAVLTENLEIIKLLLEHPKIDVNLKLLYNSENNQINESLLCYSICKCKNEITKLLLAHPKIDINSTRIIKNDEIYQEKSALFLAIENKNEEIVQCLLKNENIDVNAKIYHKESYITALHFAFKLKNEAIIKDLLSHPKININLKSFKKHTQANIMTSKEKTTLNYALKNQNIDIIKLMLSKNEINLNLKYRKLFYSEFSFTCIEKDPLEIAINHNNIIIFQLLFDYFLMRNKLSVDYLKKLYDISLDEIKELISKHL